MTIGLMATRIQAKWQTMQEVCELLGIPLHRPSKGSSVPQIFFSDIASHMGIPQQSSMPALARAIIERAHLPWLDSFSSEHTNSGGGSTVTALGLLQIKNAVLIWLGRAPLRLPSELEVFDWEPEINWQEIRDSLPRSLKEGVDRPGASTFRTLVLTEYQNTCAITRCETERAIEVAHIVPYYGNASDHMQNALPLRTDIHRLFDCGLIRIEFDEVNKLYVSKVHEAALPDYAEFDYLAIAVPENIDSRPSKKALEIKNSLSKSLWESSNFMNSSDQ
jgi:hypothetical protein